jgi:YD repeat-containing protein
LTSRIDSYVNGLLQSSSVTTKVYNNLNQLIQTTTPDNTTIKNIYNGEGLRVEKQVGNSSTKYLYSSDKVVLELNGSGNLVVRKV